MANWTGALSVFIYCSAAVFIVVGGQTPTADTVDQLVSTVARLQTELAKVAAKNDELEAEQAELDAELAKTDDKITTLAAESTPGNRKCQILFDEIAIAACTIT